MVKFNKELEERCFTDFEPDGKIGILSSVAPDGYPHMALITTIMAKTKTSIMWGQFTQGLSKKYLVDNKKTGFLVVDTGMNWWTGKALHVDSARKGEDFVRYNDKPMYRYNCYCGIGVVHYEDLVDISIGAKLPLLNIAIGACKSNYMKAFIKKDKSVVKLPDFGVNIAKKIDSLIFISYVDTDGYPRVIPAIQGAPVDNNKLIFSLSLYPELLKQIPSGAKVAVYITNLNLVGFLCQGRWSGIKKYGGVQGALFEIDKVYNPMLPAPRYVYPEQEFKSVFGE
ncbi:MAG: hypothetical protein LBT55_02350 [Clostridiaceae bacterium]|jgi:hypothetical protein|nr:hypothetical protein [Clostridiaceae bacterium]